MCCHMKISNDDCDLLAKFQTSGTITVLSQITGKDKAYLSRRLTRLSSLAPVLARVDGRWQLTPQGHELVRWYQDASLAQDRLLRESTSVKICTTQLVSERILIPKLQTITGISSFEITTDSPNAEQSLLSGKIDFALVCATPQSPSIRFKKVFNSPFLVVAPPKWTMKELFDHPYVAHSGIDVRSMLELEDDIPPPAMVFDHLVGVREAIINRIGWGILPAYAVDREIKRGSISALDSIACRAKEEFQLWWIPNRVSIDKISELIKAIK
jgi:DNA-binding transcriptional LysR family regulator